MSTDHPTGDSIDASDTYTAETGLRRVDRDLYAAAKELRAEADDIREDREAVVQKAREDHGSAEDAPQELHREYQELTEELKTTLGTAETYEHYADAWTGPDDDRAVFVLEELNGDEYAATVDHVSQAAGPEATTEGDLPGGAGMVKALEFGVVDVPPGCPPDPGTWPAPVVTELFVALNDLTAPSGVEVGNSSLADALAGTE